MIVMKHAGLRLEVMNRWSNTKHLFKPFGFDIPKQFLYIPDVKTLNTYFGNSRYYCQPVKPLGISVDKDNNAHAGVVCQTLDGKTLFIKQNELIETEYQPVDGTQNLFACMIDNYLILPYKIIDSPIIYRCICDGCINTVEEEAILKYEGAVKMFTGAIKTSNSYGQETDVISMAQYVSELNKIFEVKQ